MPSSRHGSFRHRVIAPVPFRSRSLSAFFTSLLFLLTLAHPALALDIPAPPDRWYTDKAGLLSPTEGDLLNRKLSEFEQSSGAQFIVYVLPTLEQESLEDFTIRAVERWKVGQKKYDNGLVLFVFVEEQKIRIEVGYGLEGSVTDAFSSRVIRDQIAPAFSQQQYSQGLNAAADAIMTKIRTGEEAVPPLQPRGQGQQESGEDIGIIPVLLILFIVFFFIVPMFAGRGRRSGCGGCMLPFIFPGGGMTFGGGGFGGGGFGGGGFGGGGFGGGGFGGGGGGFGGGGASGGW